MKEVVTRTHTRTLFSLCLVCQKAQTFPRDGGVCSLPHWMRSVARWCTFTRTRPRSRSGLAKSSLTQLSTLKTLFKGNKTQRNTVFFLLYIFSVSAKEGGSDRTVSLLLLLPLQMGLTCARVTLPHFSLHWLSDPLRPKHAGANKRFGLCDPDKRGFVFSGDFNVSV